jgi:hypothetical protein
MTRVADLLDRDFSKPVEEIVKVDNHDPDTVFTELTEYVATDHIKAEYECLLSAMASAARSKNGAPGVWISGFFGSGKSHFAKNLGYILANRDVRGVPASALFLKQVQSSRIADSLEFLNRAVPHETFMCDIQAELPIENKKVKAKAQHLAEVMYRTLLRDLDYAEDDDVSELEMELETEGKLAAFQDLCRAEYQDDWRIIRKGSQRLARASALLHRFAPRTYTSTDTWLNMVTARPAGKLSAADLVGRLFDRCEARRQGKTFAFVMDEIGEYVALGPDSLEHLRAVVEQFAKENHTRLKAGKIPGPASIVITAHEKLQTYYTRLAASGIVLPKPQHRFQQIELTPSDIAEAAARRVLRKRASREPVLRKLFRDCGASLKQNVRLERSSRCAAFDEDQFVRFYPFLPHFVELSVDIVAGIRLHPDAPRYLGGGNRTVVKQAFEMLVSDRTRLADQPAGVLVSIDKIYELVEGNLPTAKRNDILEIRRRFDHDKDYPFMAARVAKAICLMEFAETDLPRTTENISALLIQRVTEVPPVLAVAAILHHMRDAEFVRETLDGWTLYDFYRVRRSTAALDALNNAVGTVNPRPPGWHNSLIQLVKTLLARMLTWYTRTLFEFNASVSQSQRQVVWALSHLSTNMADGLSMDIDALDRLSMDLVALQGRLAESEKRNAFLEQSIKDQLKFLREQVRALGGLQNGAGPEVFTVRMDANWDNFPNNRTAYIIGLFGTGRRYINELIIDNIGERAKYFRDTIRLHPGPTPMIYSGHATIRHACRGQELPDVMSRILHAVRSGYANLTFVYRHPLDSLLTNWVWWRTFIRDNRSISGISQVYQNTDDLCADLDREFHDFKAFADGDPHFFSGAPGPRFLSFPEFVEETELHLESATLALRLEDFTVDPLKEFSRIAEVMAVDLDTSGLSVDPPRTRPYGYLTVREKVPSFRSFIDNLNAETRKRIEKIGYDPTV